MEKNFEKKIGGYTKNDDGGVVNVEVKIETETPDYPRDEQGNIPLDVTDKAKEAEKRKRKGMLDK